MKALIWIGAIVGSTLGGWIPALWHASLLSFSGIIGSTLGGILGIVAGYKIGKQYF